MKIKRPHHKYPIDKVAISASQNVYSDQDRTLAEKLTFRSPLPRVERIASKYMWYVNKGKMPSVKFERTIESLAEGYDQNKAMFPVYKGLPLFAITTISALEEGMEVSVLGSHEVGKCVDAIKKYYLSQSRISEAARLKWVPEYDGLDSQIEDEDKRNIIIANRKKLTPTNSMSRLKESLNLNPDEAYMFVTGDIIFYDYARARHDPDSVNHSLVLDLNGKEIINPPFDRNYYHCMEQDGQLVHFKEPNVWIFGEEFNVGHTDATYANAQKGGFGTWAFLKMAGKNIAKHAASVPMKDWVSIARTMHQGARMGAGSIPFLSAMDHVFKPEDLEACAKYIDMSFVRMKAEHFDWMKIKDVDAEHDLIHIITVLNDMMADIFPQSVAESIDGCAEYFRYHGIAEDEEQGIKIIRKFPDWLGKYEYDINELLRKWGCTDNLILPTFSLEGDFIGKLRPDEDLDQARDDSLENLARHEDLVHRLSCANSKEEKMSAFKEDLL